MLIVGYGNIGKYIYKEFSKLEPDIYDPFVEPYLTMPEKTDIAFICVPTEMLPNGSCDISAVEDAVTKANADIIVIKSAIPVGTTEFLVEKYKKRIVVSPEYYGTTQFSPESLDWVILGGDANDCAKVAQLYYRVKSNSLRVKFTDWRTAELVKYCENAFLATRVTLFNEFAKIGQLYGINYEELRECLVMDDRIGDSHSFVYSEQPYWDSHCLNKDIPALIHQGKNEAKLMRAVYEINLLRKLGEDGLDGVVLPYPEYVYKSRI